MTLRRFGISVFLLSIACGPPQTTGDILPTTQKCSEAPEVPTEGAALLVGAGGTGTFQPLASGAELPLQHGPQGGTHVYLDVLFHADVAGSWKIASQLERTTSSIEADTTVTAACAGWNRVDNVRFVLYGGGGDGTLLVRVSPIASPESELK